MSRKRRVTFVMPRTGEWASGGLRIVYEYANRLSRRGHIVSVVHPGRLTVNPTKLDHLGNAVRYVLRKLDGRYTPKTWMKVDPEVRLLCVPSLSERFVPDGDVVVATAWETAEWVSRYSASKGRRFYFIQHLETWNGPQERVFATWKAPMQKIVPSKWLVDIARGLGENAIYIPYGLDMDAFRIMTPSEDRPDNQLMMLYHTAKWKGCDDGLKALSLVREKDPNARAILFGVSPRPEALPAWTEYYRSPSPKLLCDLYNRAAIFVAPSTTEGWGLTGCEALLCGAALAATDIDGHREFAFHERTALTSPAKSPGELAKNVLRLIRDPELRVQLAKNGFDFVRQLTWDRAADAFEAALCAPAEMFEHRAALTG
jgi:glycosyltransferase involved in cell wall biosynthesis